MNLSKIDLDQRGMPIRSSRRRTMAPCEIRRREKREWLRGQFRLDGDDEDELAEYYRVMGTLALDDYWYYATEVLDYRFLDEWDHGEELFPFIEQGIGDFNLIIIPRGSMKTGSVTAPIIPWLLARDPTYRGIITNVREEKAGYFAMQAASILTSPRYRRCFPYIIPSSRWGASGYFLDLGEEHDAAVGRVDPSIGSYGVGGNMTGAHVRIMQHDDLLNEKTYQSTVEREKAQSFLVESMNCLDPGGTLNVCATRWHYDDVYGKIEKGEIQSANGKFRVFKRGAERVVLDDNGNPVVEMFNPHRFFLDFAGRRQQVGYTAQFLEAAKVNHGTSLYSALYMNEPVPDGDRLLAIDNIKEFLRVDFDLGPVARVGIEVEATAVIFFSAFLKQMREENRMIPVEKLNTGKKDKHERIRAVVGPVLTASRLYCREDLWVSPDNIGQEMKDFDKGKDDALDALTYCLLRAPKYVPGKPPQPYIAVDPAFTLKTSSDHTAVLAGCWYGEDFYILDCHKFKAQKVEIIANQIFKMYDKYNRKRKIELGKSVPVGRSFVSPGNERRNSRRAAREQRSIWGNKEEEEVA